jgi:hypothetical protein
MPECMIRAGRISRICRRRSEFSGCRRSPSEIHDVAELNVSQSARNPLKYLVPIFGPKLARGVDLIDKRPES